MSDQAILREYLVALGFRVNTNEERRMNTSVHLMGGRVLGLGKAAVATATAVVTATTAMAKGLERMVYSARYADTTVDRLQAMEFGARNVGIEGGKMTQSLMAFSAAIRSQPGLQGLLEGRLGIKVQGRKKDDVFHDFIARMKEMAPFISQQYAAMFGLDPQTLFLLTDQQDKMDEAVARRLKMNQEAGLSSKELEDSQLRYMNMWRDTTANAGVFAQVLMLAVQPAVEKLLGATDSLLQKWTHIVKDIQDAPDDLMKRLGEGLTGRADGERVTLNAESRARLGLSERDHAPDAPNEVEGNLSNLNNSYYRTQRWRESRGAVRAGMQDPYAPRLPTDPAAVAATRDLGDFKSGGRPPPGGLRPGSPEAFAFLDSIDQKYSLPPGLMRRAYMKESSGGVNVYNRKSGAMGPMQFMPETAKEYGVKNPYDLAESADAAGRKFRDLLREYHGNVEAAVAAYNLGQGRMADYGYAKHGLGALPAETRDYVKSVAGGGVTVSQDVEINIHGVSDPREAAERVAGAQRQVGADVARNFAPKVR